MLWRSRRSITGLHRGQEREGRQPSMLMNAPTLNSGTPTDCTCIWGSLKHDYMKKTQTWAERRCRLLTERLWPRFEPGTFSDSTNRSVKHWTASWLNSSSKWTKSEGSMVANAYQDNGWKDKLLNVCLFYTHCLKYVCTRLTGEKRETRKAPKYFP